jgi:hypothetical protein
MSQDGNNTDLDARRKSADGSGNAEGALGDSEAGRTKRFKGGEVMKMYVAIYRTGGTENFEWRRALPVASKEEVLQQIIELVAMGHTEAFYEDYEKSMAIGLPETFGLGVR